MYMACVRTSNRTEEESFADTSVYRRGLGGECAMNRGRTSCPFLWWGPLKKAVARKEGSIGWAPARLPGGRPSVVDRVGSLLPPWSPVFSLPLTLSLSLSRRHNSYLEVNWTTSYLSSDGQHFDATITPSLCFRSTTHPQSAILIAWLPHLSLKTKQSIQM